MTTHIAIFRYIVAARLKSTAVGTTVANPAPALQKLYMEMVLTFEQREYCARHTAPT